MESSSILSMLRIWLFTLSISALARSILFITGIIIRLLSFARYRFATVCACTPWPASTRSMAPSHALMDFDTSYVKSTCPGVSIRFSRYSLPSFALYFIPTADAFIVIPCSLSRSMLSSSWFLNSLAVIEPVNCNILSARVDLPWSICAIMQKFRMCLVFMYVLRQQGLLFYAIVTPYQILLVCDGI